MHYYQRTVAEVVATTDCSSMHHGLTTQYRAASLHARLQAPRFRLSEKKTHYTGRRYFSQIIMVLALDNCFSDRLYAPVLLHIMVHGPDIGRFIFTLLSIFETRAYLFDYAARRWQTEECTELYFILLSTAILHPVVEILLRSSVFFK